MALPVEALQRTGSGLRHHLGNGRHTWLWDRLRPPFEWCLRMASRGRGIRLQMPVPEDRFRFDLRFRSFDFAHAEPEAYQWLSRTLQAGMVVYDVGAAVGQYTLCAAKRVGPTGRVVAMEPTDANRSLLEAHLRLNELAERVVVLPCVLGDADVEATDFYVLGEGVQASNSIAYRRDVPYVERSKLTVLSRPMRRLDSIVAETGLVPDVIKLDVEGAEERVLRGAERVLREHRPLVLCGVHPFWMEGLGDSPESLLGFLRACGYRAADFDRQTVDVLTYRELLLLPE